MADKKITNNLKVFKDKETRTLAKADAQAFIKSFKHTLSMASSPEDVLATFKTSSSNVATLKRENIILNAEFLGKDNLETLKAKFPNLDYNQQTITLPMQPPEEGHVEVYSRDSGGEDEQNGGVFEVTITNEQGIKYTCIIDPLGITIKDLNGALVAEQRADFENISQEQILDADFSPELVEMIMAGRGPLKSPDSIKDLSPQLLDLYFKNGTLPNSPSTEANLKSDENNAFYLGDENGFQIMALPTPKSNEKSAEFYYLVKDKEGRKYVRDGQTFVPFEKFNFIIGHTAKEIKDKPFVLFNNNKGHEQNRFVQIPLDKDGKPDPRFAKAIEAFAEQEPSRGKGETVSLDGKPVDSNDKNQIAFQHADIDSPKHIVRQTGISTISADAGNAKNLNHDETNNDEKPNARQTAHSKEPRVNPFQKTPLKTIKKPPIKINEDAVRYGGFAITVLMLVLAFIMPLAVAPLFGMLAVGVGIGSTLLANHAKAINDNPVNKAYNKYVQTLAKAEREAESEAGKFWEAETERGNAYDRYQEFLSQIQSEDFKNSLQGALFTRFIESGAWTQENFKEFWSQDNVEMRESFLEDLQYLYAMPENNQEQLNAKTQQQLEFLKKFGVIKNSATQEEMTNALNIFNESLQAQNPETGEPMEIPASALLKGTMAYLKEFNEQEDKMFKAHDKVGDIIENCSGNTLQKIMSQKGVNFDRFIEEHALDIARRFKFRNDITASQKEELISKLKPEQIVMLSKASDDVRSAIVLASLAGNIAKDKDDKFLSALNSLESIDKIYNQTTQTVFPELKKQSQIEDDTKILLWAIHNEDVKRLTNQSKNSQDLTIENLSQITGEIDLYKTSLTQDYVNLLNTRQELLNDEKITKALANQIVELDRLATPLISSLSFANAGESSLDSTFKVLKEDKSLGDKLHEQISQVLNISSIRNQTLDSLTLNAVNALLKSSSKDSYSEEDIKNMQQEIQMSYPSFGTLPEELKENLTRLHLGKNQVYANIITSNKTEEEKQLAKQEFDLVVEKLTNGSFAEEKLERIERSCYENATKPENLPTRDEACDNVTVMNDLLKEFGITSGAKRKMIVKEASNLASSLNLTRDMLAQAIFNTSNTDLADCRLPQEKLAYLKEIFGEIYGGQDKVDVSNREKFAKAKALVEEMQQKQLERSKSKLRSKEQIAGREQVERVYSSNVKGKPIDISIQKGTYKPTRAEIRLATVKREKSEFNAGSTQVLESMKTIGKDMKDPTSSKTIMKNNIQNLQDSIEKTFGTKAMKDLFDDEKGQDALSWEKLKSGKLTEQEFKVLLEKIKKLIKKKEKKLAKKESRRKKRANKDNTKAKAKNKAKNGQDYANNDESTNMAIQNVESRNSIQSNEQSAPAQASSPAPQASSQNAESGR